MPPDKVSFSIFTIFFNWVRILFKLFFFFLSIFRFIYFYLNPHCICLLDLLFFFLFFFQLFFFFLFFQ
ncbi:MAG TPA: hypothetical protein DHW82_07240 [Spirochaetia bacterium]|nr:hypothetical protein [Spirochaetia bacterium]